MKSLSLLRDALVGWRAILVGDPAWYEHFRPSLAGLAAALALFFGLAFVFITVASLGLGVPTVSGFVAVMLAQALPLLALLVASWITRRIVPTPRPLLELLVPGVYALIAYLVLGLAFSILGGPLLVLLWAVLGFLLYRLGRMAAGWSIGIALAFAVLTVVLLVGLPVALYMLSGPSAAT